MRMGIGRRSRAEAVPKRIETLCEELPEPIRELAEARGVEPKLTVAADIGPTGRLERHWLIADAHRLLTVSPNGGLPEVTADYALDQLGEISVDNRVGNQALCSSLNGDRLELVRYTVGEAARFSKVRRRLNDWRLGEKLDEPVEQPSEDRRCAKCGQIKPEGTERCPNCVDRRAALRRLMRYMRPHLWVVALLVGLIFIGDLMSLVSPQFFGLLVDDVLAPSPDPSRRAGKVVAWLVAAGSPWSMLFQIVGWMLLLQILGTFLRVGVGRISAWLGYFVVHDIRAELYSHLQTLTLRYFDKKQTGAIMSRITQDTRAMQGFLVDGTQHMLSNVFKLFAVVTILLMTNWRLTLLTVVPAPLVVFFATAFWKRIRRYYGRLWQNWERLTASLQDSISGMRVVKAFAGEEREVARFVTDSALVADAGAGANKLRATITPWLEFSVHLSTLVVWLYGGVQILNGNMTLGFVMVFFSYLMQFYGPMQWISNLFNWFQETLAAAERVWEVLDERPDVPESEHPVPLGRVEGRFEFRDVTFGYEAHEPVLHNIDLVVEPGEMIGLVGHSGAGKSTMINLLCRFYDVDEGELLVDGVNIKDIPQSDYRRNIGVVLQENFLFNGSIFENIRYGKPDASIEEVICAAEAANAHPFIVRFPDGYDTVVGERGTRLSGGERQRISIARAILHNPKILILDEATASVDTETERQIQEALARLVKGRTTFAIAHRLSTLRNASRLVVIEKGRIAEIGTHDELVEKEDGTFAKLVRMQTDLNRIVHVGG